MINKVVAVMAPKTKFYEEAIIESEARTAVVQLKNEASPSIMIGLITRHAVCRIISRL